MIKCINFYIYSDVEHSLAPSRNIFRNISTSKTETSCSLNSYPLPLSGVPEPPPCSLSLWMWLLHIIPVSGITRQFPVCRWLILRSIVSWRFSHAGASIRLSPCVIIHSHVSEHLSSVHFSASPNMIYKYLFQIPFVKHCYKSRTAMAGS